MEPLCPWLDCSAPNKQFFPPFLSPQITDAISFAAIEIPLSPINIFGSFSYTVAAVTISG